DKSRELRFQSADEFVTALEQALLESSTSVHFDTSAMSIPSPTPIAENRPSQVSQTPAQPPPVQPPGISSPASASVILQQPGFTPVAVPSLSTQPPLPKSAAQHLFIQQRTFKARNIVVLIGLAVALAVIGGVGYLKYRSIQRLKIENAVVDA